VHARKKENRQKEGKKTERRKKEGRKERKTNYASSKTTPHINLIKEKGPLEKKSPFTRKKRAVIEDLEGCGQTSQKNCPDYF